MSDQTHLCAPMEWSNRNSWQSTIRGRNPNGNFLSWQTIKLHDKNVLYEHNIMWLNDTQHRNTHTCFDLPSAVNTFIAKKKVFFRLLFGWRFLSVDAAEGYFLCCFPLLLPQSVQQWPRVEMCRLWGDGTQHILQLGNFAAQIRLVFDARLWTAVMLHRCHLIGHGPSK